MAEIPLTRGYVAIVDEQDVPLVAGYKWHAGVSKLSDGEVVVRAQSWKYTNGQLRTVLMHRLVTDAPPGTVVDHIDRNPLNNTRANLRVCTQNQNAKNSRPRRGTSRYKGVDVLPKVRNANRYRAQICVNYRKINIGNFPTEIEAARAYDEAARKHHGRFAQVNFQEDSRGF